MSEHSIHEGSHDHVHGPDCGLTAIKHGDHWYDHGAVAVI